MSRLAALKRRTRRIVEGNEYVTTNNAAFGAAMFEAMAPADVLARARGSDAYCLIVLVPTQQHVEIVADGVEAVAASEALVVPLVGRPVLYQADSLLGGAAQGKVVVAVASSPAHIPASFTALADATISLGAHDAEIVHRALRLILRQHVPRLPKDFIVHPDPELLLRCIVKEMPPRKIIAALAKLGRTFTAAGRESLPHLADCPEFGAARSWGLSVMRDIAAWKAGALPATDLDTACLLVSPPGYGKTTMAKVLAHSMGVPLIQVTVGSIFKNEGYLGDVLRTLREQFAAAEDAAPVVLLLDELDSFSRRDVPDHNRGFTVALINELLTLLDGASEKKPGLVIIGATNNPDGIDPALLRPGRLSRTIHMSLPDPAGIQHILRVHLRDDLAEVDLAPFVRMAIGSTPAHLMDVVRRARESARSQGRQMVADDLKSELLGPGQYDEETQQRVALHEAGHAMACLVMEDAPALRSISLIGQGSELGRVDIFDLDGPATRSKMEAKVMVYLAGIAAEDMVYGQDDRSDGASQDLSIATRLVGAMHAQLGMGDTLVHFRSVDERLRDAEFAGLIERELQRLMKATRELLAEYQMHIMAIALATIASRFLTGAEALRVVESIDSNPALRDLNLKEAAMAAAAATFH